MKRKSTARSSSFFLRTVALACACFLALGPAASAQEPVTVSGAIELDGIDFAQGAHAIQVNAALDFFADATSTQSLGLVTAPASIAKTGAAMGLFSIQVQVPSRASGLGRVWFALAIDSDQNGLDPRDWFDGRFAIDLAYRSGDSRDRFPPTGPNAWAQNNSAAGAATSYLNGPPREFLCPMPQTFAWTYGYLVTAGDLQVAPFMTPAAGLRFNRFASVFSTRWGDSWISFAVYDGQGRLVVRSRKVKVPDTTDVKAQFIVAEIPGTILAPSTLYYTAWTSNDGSIYTACPALPTVPGIGYVDGVAPDATCPNSFNTTAVTTDDNAKGRPLPASITMFWDGPLPTLTPTPRPTPTPPPTPTPRPTPAPTPTPTPTPTPRPIGPVR